MNTACDVHSASSYKSPSQRTRVATESWFGVQGYCLACSSDHLSTTKPNSKVRDFECPKCQQSYELKSSAKAIGQRLVDGAYATMLERIKAEDAPVLILLRYVRGSFERAPWLIEQLTAIHPIFLTDSIVEPRKPLSAHAVRAGWQGCILRVDRIPPEGRISLISSGVVEDRVKVRTVYEYSQRLKSVKPASRGWTALVLRVIRDIGGSELTLSEIYARRKVFEEAYPQNDHIEATIRQQLQVLRDLGYLNFCKRGTYEVVG